MATATLALPINPLPLQDASVSYGGYDLRLLLGAMYNRPGRLGLGDGLTLLPRLAGANWSVDVQAGQAVVSGTANTYAPERYLVSLAARTNISLAAFNTAPAATRTHGVYLVVDDANYTGATFAGRIVVVEDTTGSGTTAPAGSFVLQLGTVTIGTGQANIAAANLATTMPRAGRNTPSAAPSYYTGFGTGAQVCGYSLDGNTVRLQGTVQRTSGNFASATSYTVANLPVGYRPTATRIGLGTSGAAANLVRILITTGGDIQITPFTAGGDAAYVALDGFSFEIY